MQAETDGQEIEMKLHHLHEATYHKTKTKVAVYEITSGRYGDMSHDKSVLNINDLIKFMDAAVADDEEAMEDLDMPWGISAVLYNYKPKEIMDSIKKKQGWAGEHEEGVIGLSVKGPAHAKTLATVAWAGGEDDEEEDWY